MFDKGRFLSPNKGLWEDMLSLDATVIEKDRQNLPLREIVKNSMDLVICKNFESHSVDNKIFAIGGMHHSSATPVVEIYDPATDTWTNGINMPTARAFLGAGVIDNKIYTFGGYIPWAGVPTVEVFDTGLKGEGINLKGKLPASWAEIKTQAVVKGK